MVTQSGYFRIENTVALGIGTTDGKHSYCHGVAELNLDKKCPHWSTTTGRFMTDLIITLHINLVDQL